MPAPAAMIVTAVMPVIVTVVRRAEAQPIACFGDHGQGGLTDTLLVV